MPWSAPNRSDVCEATRDGRRRRAFVLLHVPLFAGLLWLVAHPDEAVRYGTMLGLDVFLVVHAGLHWRPAGRPTYEFGTPHSRLLIFGTAGLAATHALVHVIVGLVP